MPFYQKFLGTVALVGVWWLMTYRVESRWFGKSLEADAWEEKPEINNADDSTSSGRNVSLLELEVDAMNVMRIEEAEVSPLLEDPPVTPTVIPESAAVEEPSTATDETAAKAKKNTKKKKQQQPKKEQATLVDSSPQETTTPVTTEAAEAEDSTIESAAVEDPPTAADETTTKPKKKRTRKQKQPKKTQATDNGSALVDSAPQETTGPILSKATETEDSPPSLLPETTTTTPREKTCTHADRRDLARRGEEATDAEWSAMADCISKKDRRKNGQFFQHISKSGGTSIGDLMSERKCFVNPKKGKTKNGEYRNVDFYDWNANALGLNCNWIRKESVQTSEGNYLHLFNFLAGRSMGRFMLLNGGMTKESTSCKKLDKNMFKSKRIAMMSEAVIPFSGANLTTPLCPNLLNSIMFREPLSRIKSHYQHIHQWCRQSKKKGAPECDANFLDRNGTFNVPPLVKWLDIVSDNYYTRSLLGPEWYQYHAPYDPENILNSTISKHPAAWTTMFPKANRSLHAFDWVMLLGSGQEDEASERNLILQYGMGLGHVELPHSRTHKKKKKGEGFSDAETLQAINRMDMVLWEEAKKLNRLDVVSLKRMGSYLNQTQQLPTAKENSVACCGHVCSNFTKKPS